MPTREETHREIEDAGRAHDARVVENDRFREWPTPAEADEMARLDAIKQRRRSRGTPSEL